MTSKTIQVYGHRLYHWITWHEWPRIDVHRCTSILYIDEAFADLTGISAPEYLARQIRAQVLKQTGIPTGIGIGPTKTLAKLANAAAKKWQAQTGGVVHLDNDHKRDWLLKRMAVDEVWGVGRRMKEHLSLMGINTAWDLAQADAWTLKMIRPPSRKYAAVEHLVTACMKKTQSARPSTPMLPEHARSYGRRARCAKRYE